jgi:hypothetical protein
MGSNIDWKGVIRELRLLVTQLQPARFFALYALLLLFVLSSVADKFWRNM